MHVLPIGLPALLPGMVALEAARLKLQLNAAVPGPLREAMSRFDVTCHARLQFDARGRFKALTTSLARSSPEDFEVHFPWETFGLLRYPLEPLFNLWGEPWPKRGRRKPAAADSQEVAKTQ